MVLKVVITGAAGQIAYSLLSLIARGEMFGSDQHLILHLLEVEPAMPFLTGLVMELQDCSYPLVDKIITTCDPMVAFNDVDFALLVGAMPRKPGMERKDLLQANVKIFEQQGKAMDKVAKKSVKVVVVGNPANTNCLICSKYAPSIPPENFSALTRLDHNRAIHQIAAKLNVPCASVRNVIIWGNHSGTQFADARYATVTDGSTSKPVPTAIGDESWLKTEFLSTVQKRGAAVLEARKASSALSAAKAIVDHMHNWFLGTPQGTWVSMAVMSDGSYGTEKGLVFSFPVTIYEGKWNIVPNLKMDDWAREKIEITTKELKEEKEAALAECQ